MDFTFEQVKTIDFDPNWVDKSSGLPIGISEAAKDLEDGTYYGIYSAGNDEVRKFTVNNYRSRVATRDHFAAHFEMPNGVRLTVGNDSVIVFSKNGGIVREYRRVRFEDGREEFILTRKREVVWKVSPNSYTTLDGRNVEGEIYGCVSKRSLLRFLFELLCSSGYSAEDVKKWDYQARVVSSEAKVNFWYLTASDKQASEISIAFSRFLKTAEKRPTISELVALFKLLLEQNLTPNSKKNVTVEGETNGNACRKD